MNARDFALIICILFFPWAACAAEVQLPEKVILGQEKSIPYYFPFRYERLKASGPVLAALPSAHLPTLTYSRLDFSAGTRNNVSASYTGQKDAFYWSVAAASGEVKPFPGATGRLVFSAGRKTVNRFGLLDFAVSAGYLWNPPAARETNGSFVPDNFSQTGLAGVSLSSILLPDKKVRPFLSVAYHLPSEKRDGSLKLMWPDWTGEIGFFIQFSEKTVCRLMLDYEGPVDYGDPSRSCPEKWLPALEISYVFRPAEALALRVSDFTDRQYAVFPDRQGPGTSAVFSYTRMF